ncbi:MAG: 2'-5' RNA ligase family protein, partial [Mycobacterium sp.]|nr:2'-5' RNA ligase family protein [Mycobacterium sp.]
MALAVCLLFDRPSERAVRALWDRLEQHCVPSLRSHTHGRHVPHVSYAVLRSWDQEAVTAALADLGDGAPVQLSF